MAILWLLGLKNCTSSPGIVGFIVPHPVQFIIRHDIPFWWNGTFCSWRRFLRCYRSFGTENRSNCECVCWTSFRYNRCATRLESTDKECITNCVSLINTVHKLGKLYRRRGEFFLMQLNLLENMVEETTCHQSSSLWGDRAKCSLNSHRIVAPISRREETNNIFPDF